MPDRHGETRAEQIERFLAASGWGGAQRFPLAGDASFRRYERLVDARGTAMLMDAPPPRENLGPYLTVARHLVALGYSAPRILAADVSLGLAVIEDFGDETYTRRLADGADEGALYALAVDLLVDLHRRADAAAVDVPPYDEERLLAEAALLTDWYLPAIAGQPTPAAIHEEYFARWRAALALARAAPSTLVLRDYHVDNLMWLGERSGLAACGLLDFQDAVVGPSAYDLVSLLEDARRDVPPALQAAMLARYLDCFSNLDAERFTAAYAILGAQRNAKIIGIFTRLCARDGKPVYLRHIPRVWRLLEGDLRHPALAGMRDWFDRHCPPALRIQPDPARMARPS